MAQILDPLPDNSSDRILCCYVNATSKVQVARITNIPNWYFERVVFPGQRLVFEGMPEALLEIHCGMMATAILSDKIPCDRLQVNEEAPASADTARKQQDEKMDKTPVWEGIKKTLEIPSPLITPALATVK